MKELSIKIKIADREYPMKVIPEDEECIRKAGRIINEKIKHYAQQFGIDDKQDLLAMVAFDILADKSQKEEIEEINDDTVTERISGLNNMVSRALET
jgi:cell division protein ZapA